jgi:hypothetical protein
MYFVNIARRVFAGVFIGGHVRRVAVSSVAVAALAGVNAGAAMATSGVQCAQSSTYGSQCIDVYGSGLQVTDIQTWFTTPNTDFLSGKKWRIDLERYNCSPIGKPKSQCPVAATWLGNTRSGNPPVGGSTCITLGGDPIAVQQCENYGLAYADAKNGYWASFYSLPHTFGSNLWLCTELSIYNSSTGKWVFNAAGLTNGLRGCASVHS